MNSLPQVESRKAVSLTTKFMESLRPGQLLESLFDAIPGAFFFIKDRESKFVGGSDSFAHTMGAPSMEEMIGKTDYDFAPDFLADGFYQDDQRLITTGQPMLNKVELVPSADGSLDWLCTSKIPLFGLDGAIVGLAGVARIIQDKDAVYAEHPEMHRIVDHVRAHFGEKLSVADMAKVGGISVSSQERLFRRIFGLTPLMYLRKTRLNAACRLLRESSNELGEIAVQCGFNDQTSMTRAFRTELNITPLRYRRRFMDSNTSRTTQRGLRTLFPSA